MVFEGGTILKQDPFWEINVSLKRNTRGSNFMAQQQQSREFDISDLSPIPLLGKRKEFDTISGPRLYTSQIEASTSPPPPLGIPRAFDTFS